MEQHVSYNRCNDLSMFHECWWVRFIQNFRISQILFSTKSTFATYYSMIQLASLICMYARCSTLYNTLANCHSNFYWMRSYRGFDSTYGFLDYSIHCWWIWNNICTENWKHLTDRTTCALNIFIIVFNNKNAYHVKVPYVF